MATGLLLDSLFEKHDTGHGHPESSHRIVSVAAALRDLGLVDQCTPISLRAATDAELSLAHDTEYIELVRREIPAGVNMLSTGDTVVCQESLEVALNATGGLLNAVDEVMEGRLDNAFCAVRPPGHHATPSRGMGFCIFNNVAVAARYARQKHGIQRVAIIDWDVHHGNGTQDCFYEDGDVFYFSTHQHPWYPGTGDWRETGSGKGEGTTLNAPFPAGTDMKPIKEAFTDAFLKAMKDFSPELVLISAGFDSRANDPLGRFELTDTDFQELTKLLMGLAEQSSEHRVVSVLEGGYSLTGLTSAVTAHLRTLISG